MTTAEQAAAAREVRALAVQLSNLAVRLSKLALALAYPSIVPVRVPSDSECRCSGGVSNCPNCPPIPVAAR